MKFQPQDLNILALADSYNLEKFDPEVLREYDIRGIVDKNLTFNTAYTIGRTFGHIVCSQSTTGTIVVGYDGRLTSPKLHEVLCKGLVDTGIKVISIGMCPTPMVYFAHFMLFVKFLWLGICLLLSMRIYTASFTTQGT